MIAVKLNQLSKKYGRRIGISGIDLTINEGEIFGLIGPDGAGKTTILRILMNFISPSDGEAEVFDMDVTKESKKIKKDTVYVPGDVYFYHKRKASKYLKTVLRAHHQKKNPAKKELIDRFELDLKERFGEMDRSDQKKLALAAALLSNARLLLLDEPLRGLDAMAQGDLFRYLGKLKSEGSTVLITGRDSEEIAALCDRMAVIENGEITVSPENFDYDESEAFGENTIDIFSEESDDEEAAAGDVFADTLEIADEPLEEVDNPAPAGDGWDEEETAPISDAPAPAAAAEAIKPDISLRSKGFDREAFTALGAKIVSEEENKVVLEYDGDVHDLAKFLYDKEMNDLTINDEALKEAFQPFFKGGDE